MSLHMFLHLIGSPVMTVGQNPDARDDAVLNKKQPFIG